MNKTAHCSCGSLRAKALAEPILVAAAYGQGRAGVTASGSHENVVREGGRWYEDANAANSILPLEAKSATQWCRMDAAGKRPFRRKS